MSSPGSDADGTLVAKLGRAVGEGRPAWASELHERLVAGLADRVTRVRAERGKGPLPTGYLWRVACVEAIERVRRARAEHQGAPPPSRDEVQPERLWRLLRDDRVDKKLDKARRRDPALAEDFALARAFLHAADRDEAVTGVEMAAAEISSEDEPALVRRPEPPRGRAWIIAGLVAAALVVVVLLARG